MSSYEAPGRTKVDPRAYLLPVLVALGLVAVLLRLWYLQIVRGEELSNQALKGRTVSVPIPAPRGQIVDRSGAPLAIVRPALALMVTPAPLLKRPDVVASVAELTGIDKGDLDKQIKTNLFRRHLPFVAKIGLTEEQALAIDERRAFFPGVFVRTESVRSYPLGPVAAHIVGYVGALSESDVDRLRESGQDLPTTVGKVGLERKYDVELLGLSGKQSVEIDARGRQMRPQTAAAPVPGAKLVLTLDAELQKLCTNIMSGHKGGIVALDPTNGEVLAMASGPTYDTNVFAERGPTEKIQAILQNTATPMHNRAAGSSYAPGSTFKIVTLVAGLRAGIITPSTTFDCNGSIRIGNRTFRCLGHHGRINYATAMEKSCNVFYASAAEQMRRTQLAAVATEFGLGVKTGIDLPSERAGIIPTDEWLSDHKLKWYPGDTINSAVGQGYVEATPLQMANLISIVANCGVSYRPHLLRTIQYPGANEKPKDIKPEIANRVQVPTEWWDRLQSALLSVVRSGTARAAQVPGISVAGKTGSAEHRIGQKSHSWFIAYAPAENPKIAIAIVIETAGHGGDVAAPMARQIIQRYLNERASASNVAARDASPSAR